MRRGELDELLAFATIARACSFTRAAAELNVSPSALSHTMRSLEQRLGVRLLSRTTRSVAPTPAGERLLGSVEFAIREVKTGLAAMDAWRGVASGTIRLTTSTVGAHGALASALPKFLLDYPNVSVEVIVDDRLNNLVTDGFDAGIRFGYAVEKDMVAVRIGPDVRNCIVGAPAYFERHPHPLTPPDLDEHTCINYRLIGSGGLLPWELERDGKEIRVRPKGQFVVSDGYLALAAVLEGVGLGYVLEDNAAPHLESGRLVQVLQDWCEPYSGLHLYYPVGQVTPALRAFIDALKWKPSDQPKA